MQLNTMDNPTRGFRDETERVKCLRCGNWFALGKGVWDTDADMYEISMKHVELCEGDAAATLQKIEAWWASRT